MKLAIFSKFVFINCQSLDSRLFNLELRRQAKKTHLDLVSVCRTIYDFMCFVCFLKPKTIINMMLRQVLTF